MTTELLSLETILAAKDQTIEKLAIPEWGGHVFVRNMSALERDKYEQAHLTKKLANYRATIAACSVCDEEGKLLFSSANIAELAKKSAKPLDRIFEVSMRLSGISEKDIEELEKN